MAAALDGAAADEVTPAVTPGEGWTPERVEWLRAFHRDRRPGLDGPAAEATWAVVEVAGRARVVGGARLRRLAEPGVVEVGLWLARDARGRGLGAEALGLVVDRARAAGARRVVADTAPGNRGALAALRSVGFATRVDREGVRAQLPLNG
ncbi:N-acetyltransferase [Blastococcus sp. TF02A-30]|nr:N-acetyltransferase [Blastococcus sp. TF02A-30]